MAGEAYPRDGTLSGTATGLTDLDRLMGGLQRSDLIILAARPAMGKTLARHQHRLPRRQELHLLGYVPVLGSVGLAPPTADRAASSRCRKGGGSRDRGVAAARPQPPP